jgi:hypothetical protein
MKKPMHMRSLITVCCLAVVLVGCSDPRDTAGHLEPGNSIRVAQQALGTSGNGYNDGASIGSVPFIDYRAPNIPIMVDGVVDYIFVYSSESADGEAERDETWVKVKVQEQSFTKAHRNNSKSLLNDAQAIPRTGIIPNSARLKQPVSGSNAQPLPLVGQGAPPQTRLTVAELDASGNPRVIGSTNIPTPTAPTGGAAPTGNPASSAQVQEMLQYFNAQQQARAQSGQNGGTTTTPNPAPVPRAP